MKVVNLTCRTAEGELIPFAAAEAGPMVELAKQARVSGLVDVGGQSVRVTRGVVTASFRQFPLYQFVVGEVAAAAVEASPEVEQPAGNARRRRG